MQLNVTNTQSTLFCDCSVIERHVPTKRLYTHIQTLTYPHTHIHTHTDT